MQRSYVTSSNLRSVGYDPPTETLEIEFVNGSVYQYNRVPERIYLGLMNADSKGRYHHRNIVGRYRYQKTRWGY